ncbi:MAG TPA: CDP-glucose 4,6-dehydratase [Agriterribacter sp.]|nr:CDP-glucose 4,6-dehydratase [Agriterribacter sp.]
MAKQRGKMENMVTSSTLSKYYQQKKVFITGHTGFKGTWLMCLLKEMGASVKGYALAPAYEQGLFDLITPMQIGESVIADIRDRKKLLDELKAFEPDYVFHLAAQPLVRRSYIIPAETFDVNVTGTANLLETVSSLAKPCAIVVVTTDKVYENKEQDILYKEEDRLGGYDPYSASKACTELVVSAFRNSFFNPAGFGKHQKAIASARAGNVIGGGDWSADRIIPDIVRSLQEQKDIEIRNPSAVRPWQHVLEPLTGYLLLGGLLHEDHQRYSSAYNFGPLPHDHLSVRSLVETAIQSWGSGAWKDISSANEPHEAGLLQLDISRAMNELQWHPKLSASTAVEWTINWYKQSLDQRAAYTFEQIKAYLAL